MSETTIDLSALRAHFPADVVGKLPKVTCPKCSKGSCDEHRKIKCGTCGNYISERHIHIEYVGHADVTGRLLEVDPEWSWKPKSTDPDPEALKAAVASGDVEVLRLVLENAPPRFERNSNGYPVGFWMLLTVGGVTRPGYGSCPATQMDAEKVLIGDALRNAAMRFGVALAQWQKGDREDPTAENSTGSDKPEPHARAAQQPRGQVGRPQDGNGSRPASQVIPADWQTAIDGMTTRDEADKVFADLKDAVRVSKTVSPAMGNVIRAAIKAKADKFPAVEPVA